MFEKFGEFDSYEEINRAAKAQLEGGLRSDQDNRRGERTGSGRRRGLLHRCNRGTDNTESCGNGKTGTGSERSESDRSTERLDGFYRTVMFRGRRDGLCSQKKREVIERLHGSDLKECI